MAPRLPIARLLDSLDNAGTPQAPSQFLYASKTAERDPDTRQCWMNVNGAVRFFVTV